MKSSQKAVVRCYARIGLNIGLVILGLVWLIPFILMVLTALKSSAEIGVSLPWELPKDVTFSNFGRAAERGNLATAATNSLIIALIKVPVGLLLSSLLAFALARLRFRYQRVLLGIVIMGSMVPVQVAIGPLFGTIMRMGLLGSKAGLILPYLAFGLPFQVFMLYGALRGIPRELEESARIDGASTFRVFRQVCLPLIKPTLAALFILDFVSTWNEYSIAVALIQRQDAWTIPLALQGFNTQFSSEPGQMNAYLLMSIVPVLVVYLAFQKYFVRGALSGSVKG